MTPISDVVGVIDIHAEVLCHSRRCLLYPLVDSLREDLPITYASLIGEPEPRHEVTQINCTRQSRMATETTQKTGAPALADICRVDR